MIKLKAEWEKQECVMVVYPHKNSDWAECLCEIQSAYMKFIEAICFFQTCLVLCESKEDEKLFKNIPNVQTLHVKTNDTWIRDFGGIEVERDGKILTYDFTFNAWGGKFESELDNAVNEKLFKFLKGTLIKEDFILEGGSIDGNGKGALLTTSACIYNENRNSQFSKQEIKKKICSFFGIEDFICLENGFIKGDDTDSHVDLLARFIDEDTIAYHICEDESDEHYESLKNMEKELKKTRYKLLPIPLPQKLLYEKRRLGASYINFLHVNGGLIVPTYGVKNDKRVLEIFQKHLHVKVVGVDARVFLKQNGSLHCASMNRYDGIR